MILSDGDILRRLEDGDLVVEPLDDPELQIQPASIDLRLGQEFLEFQRTNISCIHPDSEREIEEYVSESYVEDGDEFILHPGDFVLGTTHERVEIPPDLLAHVQGRSSLGRLAVVIHASLPYDEEVFLWTPEDGFGFYEIGRVVEDEVTAKAVSFDPQTLRIRTHPVTDHLRNPTKRIFRVRLQSGRQVHVTRDHNLFTLDSKGNVTRIPSEQAEGKPVMVPASLPDPRPNEKSLDLVDMFRDSDEVIAYMSDGLGTVSRDDTDGCRTSQQHYDSRNSAPLSCVSSVDVPDETEVAFEQSTYRLPRCIDVTTELGWTLGFYVAEGSARRNQLQFSNKNETYLQRVADWFERFDANLNWYERENGVTCLTVRSALWSNVFRSLAGSGRTKNVPERAWNWSDSVLTALLEGLLDGDGCRRDARDTLYTANRELANRVVYLASRLGKHASMYSRERNTTIEPSDGEYTGTEWSINIKDDPHKSGQYVPIPSDLLREYRRQADMTMQEAAEAMGYSSPSSISNIENEEYDSVKRESLQRLRETYTSARVDTARLDRILEGDVRFERVVNVAETDRVEPTYDLEVQPSGRPVENFLGGRGGVFLSNTAGVVDAGYRGQITLELSNLGTAPVALTPGMRISQLILTELKTPAERPYGSERGSKYQDQTGPQASRIQGDDEFGGDQ